MKGEDTIRQMFRSIRDGVDQGRINPDFGNAQLMVMLWILDAGSPGHLKWHDLLMQGRKPDRTLELQCDEEGWELAEAIRTI